MANQIKIKRGLKANIPRLNEGELGYATNTKELYVGNASGGNTLIGPTSASITTCIPYITKYDSGTHELKKMNYGQFLCMGRGTLKLGKDTSTLSTSIVDPMMLQIVRNSTTGYQYYVNRWTAAFTTGNATGGYPGYYALYMQVPSGMTVYQIY